MISVLLAVGSMAFRDMLGTLLVVAEAKGRAWLAATLDALGDIANIGVYVTGAGAVLDHGLSPHTYVVVGAMVVTSFFGTALWTRIGRRLTPDSISPTP